jgi:hypothetical protein
MASTNGFRGTLAVQEIFNTTQCTSQMYVVSFSTWCEDYRGKDYTPSSSVRLRIMKPWEKLSSRTFCELKTMTPCGLLGRYLQVHKALQPRRPTSTSSPPWEPQVSYKKMIYYRSKLAELPLHIRISSSNIGPHSLISTFTFTFFYKSIKFQLR